MSVTRHLVEVARGSRGGRMKVGRLSGLFGSLPGSGICRLPLLVGFEEVAESVSLHLFVEDDVVAEREKVLGMCRLAVEQVAHGEFQTVEVVLRNVACGVHKILEKVIFIDGLEYVFLHVEVACSAFVELDIVHGGKGIWLKGYVVSFGARDAFVRVFRIAAPPMQDYVLLRR